MNVFLSWSGEKSKDCALALRQWLPMLFPTVAPWMSEEDIRKGKPWTEELKQALSQARFGIICVNPSNIGGQWLLYEAGALAYAMDDAYVATFLVALSPRELAEGPLSIFQHTVFKKDDVRRLARTVNSAFGSEGYGDHELQERYEEIWPALENMLSPIVASFDQSQDAGEKIPISLSSTILAESKSETERLPRDAESILRQLADQPDVPMGVVQIGGLLGMHQSKARVRLNELLSNRFVVADGHTIGGDAYRIAEKGNLYLVQYDLV